MTAMEERQALVVAATQHRQEVQRALADLKNAVQDSFAVGDQLWKHIGQHPLPWLVTGLLAGLWLGSRR